MVKCIYEWFELRKLFLFATSRLFGNCHFDLNQDRAKACYTGIRSYHKVFFMESYTFICMSNAIFMWFWTFLSLECFCRRTYLCIFSKNNCLLLNGLINIDLIVYLYVPIINLKSVQIYYF